MEKINELTANIRTKPVGVRKLIQVLSALALTSIIVLISLSVTFFGAEKVSNNEEGTESASPFSILKQSFTEAFTAAGEQWNAMDVGLGENK